MMTREGLERAKGLLLQLDGLREELTLMETVGLTVRFDPANWPLDYGNPPMIRDLPEDITSRIRTIAIGNRKERIASTLAELRDLGVKP